MAKAYGNSIYFGIIAGMRSMAAPALVSDHYSKEHSSEVDDLLLGFMASQITSTAFKILAAGELAADKYSFIPNRIDPGPLAFRAISGAVCGATICTAKRKRADLGAIAGALAAVASAFAFYHVRRKLRTKYKLTRRIAWFSRRRHRRECRLEDTQIAALFSRTFLFSWESRCPSSFRCCYLRYVQTDWFYRAGKLFSAENHGLDFRR